MDDMDALFGGPLGPDPEVALSTPTNIPTHLPGPLPKVQLLIEFVGPRSISASQAMQLLAAPWYANLGQPEIWAMSASDAHWMALGSSPANSLDSLALSWDLVSARGSLSAQSSATLLATSERFAAQIQRRAIPLPIPADVDGAVAALEQARDALDIGFSVLTIASSGAVAESQIWRDCSRLGLSLEPDGAFAWTVGERRLLEVTSVDDESPFSLGSVRAGKAHSGVCIGFNVARCPDPGAALDAAYYLANSFASSWPGAVFDDTGNPVSTAYFQAMKDNLGQALGGFRQIGIVPGSPEAVRLFA